MTITNKTRSSPSLTGERMQPVPTEFTNESQPLIVSAIVFLALISLVVIYFALINNAGKMDGGMGVKNVASRTSTDNTAEVVVNKL